MSKCHNCDLIRMCSLPILVADFPERKSPAGLPARKKSIRPFRQASWNVVAAGAFGG